ncbi:MAG: energy transducer TonB [Asticcacaulis sp.]
MMRFLHGLTVAVILGFTAPATAQNDAWLTSARASNPLSQYLLGRYYEDSAQTKTLNMAEALRWYQSAAALGQSDAIIRLCAYYAAETGDMDEAMNYCPKAVILGDAVSYLTTKDGSERYGPYNRSELSEAYAFMGDVFTTDRQGLGADGRRAVALLRKAAELGRSEIYLRLREIYLAGKLTPANPEAALQMARLAAAHNQPEGIIYMAEHYDRGLGTAIDPDEAFRLYYIAAQKNIPAGVNWMTAHTKRETVIFTRRRIQFTPSDQFDNFTINKTDIYGQKTEISLLPYFFGRFADNYPDKALDHEQEGVATVSCRWSDEGTMENCVVLSESPTGWDFAFQTVSTAQKPFDVVQKDAFKALVKGKWSQFRFRWTLEE